MVEQVESHSWTLTKRSRDFMETNPMQRLPDDYEVRTATHSCCFTTTDALQPTSEIPWKDGPRHLCRCDGSGVHASASTRGYVASSCLPPIQSLFSIGY